MRLLDRVESWDEESVRCVAWSHRDPANPLRHEGRLPVVAGLEYAAQAIGVHVGLQRGGGSNGPVIGVVGGVRDVVCCGDRLDVGSDELIIEAIRLLGDDRGVLYRFVLLVGGAEIMSGRLSIFFQGKAV
jgi:predicted hotdog family 3-hydroxylacyl-ACP dehydratase